MLSIVKGDFFEYDADIRINTVNCVGVMGTGVALAFKEKYPDMFKYYAKQCKSGEIKPGTPSVWRSGDMFSKNIEIINFPTKDHWKNPSEYEYIEKGLIWLSNYLKEKDTLTLTLPALGCGHGGLDWVIVKKLIQKYLGDSHHKILVFEPTSSKKAGKPNQLSTQEMKQLSRSGIAIIDKNEVRYPDRLRGHTEKPIYLFGEKDLSVAFDISVIASTKPSEQEQKVISSIIDYSKKNSLSLLFGSTAFDKRQAVHIAKEGRMVGVFLPSGIFKAADNIVKKDLNRNINLLSIGNPFKSFDRKEFIPSVLSRILMSKVTIFTTNKLSWLEKHKNKIKNNHLVTYYANYDSVTTIDDKILMDLLESKPINIIEESVNIEILAHHLG